MHEPKGVSFEPGTETCGIDQRKVRSQLLNRSETAFANFHASLAGKLQHDRKCAASGNQREGVFKRAIHSGVLEDQGGVNQLHGLDRDRLRGQIDAMQIQVEQRGVALTNGIEIELVHIQPHHASGDFAIDTFEPISARNAENRNRYWLTECNGLSKEIRENP